MTIIACNCRIIDSDGNSQVLSEDAEKTDLPETTRKLLEHAQWVSVDVVNVCGVTDTGCIQGKKLCLDMAMGISELEQKLKNVCFPVTLRR